jgi:ferritin
MLNKKIEKALNKQIAHEFTVAHAYLGMAAWLAGNNWPGFARWMNAQHGEELSHALKLFAFVNDRGGQVELESVPKPRAEFSSPTDVFALALKTEEATTASVNEVYALAVAEKDYATQSFLKWYVDEQVEEEKNANEILAMLKLAGDSKGTLLMLDHKLGKRGEKS